MKKYLIGIFALIVIAGGMYWLATLPEKPGEYDALAACIAEKEATFYGAFWCPVCQNQKAMFGKAADKLPYEECSTPNGRDQLQICKDKQIVRYPTWIFGGGERIEGLLSREELAEKTGCELPTF